MRFLTDPHDIPLPFIISASILAGFFVFFPITDADIFWHLASGREMVHAKAFLFHDPFSYTPVNSRWIDLHWLFQIVMFAIHQAGGTALMLVCKWLCFTVATLLLFTAFRIPVISLPFLLLFVTIAYGQRYLVPLRPILFTLVFIALYLFSFERILSNGHRRWIAVLLVTQTAWVNSQGLFLIGPAIALAYTSGEWLHQLLHQRFPKRFYSGPSNRTRTILLILPPALLIVSCINPYGIHAISFAGKLFGRITPTAGNIYSSMITENMPLLRMPGTVYAHYPLIIGILFFLVLGTALISRRYLRISLLGLAAAGFVLAVMAQRNGILGTFLAFPSILFHAGKMPYPKKQMVRYLFLAVTIVAAGGTGICILRHSNLLRMWPHTISPFSHPTESAKYLENHPPAGNIFNADRYGGYLLWHLFPEHKVFCDTRLTLRSDSFFREYLALLHSPDTFAAIAGKWNITCAVIPLAPIQLYTPLALYLYREDTWDLVYSDGAEALFYKRTDPHSRNLSLNNLQTIDSLVHSLNSRYFKSAAVTREAHSHLAAWCSAIGSFKGAELVLTDRTDWESRLQLAKVKELQGQTAAAELILESAHAAHPRNHHITMNLIYFYLEHGQEDKALDELSRILRKNPLHQPARNLLFTLKKGTRKK